MQQPRQFLLKFHRCPQQWRHYWQHRLLQLEVLIFDFFRTTFCIDFGAVAFIFVDGFMY